MRLHGKLIIALLPLCLLAGCSSNPFKRDKPEEEPSLYELPEIVDYQKAARLNVELGLSYLKQGQTARGKSKLLRARNLAPELPEVHYAYGYFLETVGEVDEAKKAYMKAIAVDPKSGDAHNNYGTFLCRQHQYHESEKEFLKAVADPHYTNTAETYENAGLCILQTKDRYKAIEYLEKALWHDPARGNALLELAILKYQQKEITDAQLYHKRYMQMGQSNARALLLAMELARINGDKSAEAKYRLMLNNRYPGSKRTDLFNIG